jgi:sugar lactone lactonase YvrE
MASITKRGRSLVGLALAVAVVACHPTGPGPADQAPGTILTVAGGLGSSSALDIAMRAGDVAVHGGHVYVSGDGVIRQINRATGEQAVIAGTGIPGTDGDGGPATQAHVDPRSMTVDTAGNPLFVDAGTSIRRIDAGTGRVDRLFGAPPGDDSWRARTLAVEPGGAIVYSLGSMVLRWPAPSVQAAIVAGSFQSGYSGDGGPATSAMLSAVTGLAVDPAGNIYLSDSANHRVRRVDTAGIITTVAGDGTPGSGGDGGPATSAQVGGPEGLAFAPDGDLLIAQSGGSRLRRVDADTGVISTVAGIGETGFSGDGGPAVGARLQGAREMSVAADGSLYLADATRVRRIDPGGVIDTVAGNGSTIQAGDGGPALDAQFTARNGVALAPDGHLYFIDHHTVRRVDRDTLTITTVAGTGESGYSGDGGPAVDATLREPRALGFDRHGNLFIADSLNNVVRRVDVETGVITTVAGDGGWWLGPATDGIPATDESLSPPHGVAVADDGTLYLSEYDNSRIRRVDAQTGIITTVPGTDGVAYPTGLALDDAGGLYAVHLHGPGVRRYDLATGAVTHIAGVYGGSDDDGVPATNAWLHDVQHVAVASDGAVLLADAGTHRVRRVDPTTGTITTVAGDGRNGYAGDGGAATAARLASPTGLAVDAHDNLFVSEWLRIRRVADVAPDGTG